MFTVSSREAQVVKIRVQLTSSFKGKEVFRIEGRHDIIFAVVVS